MEQDSTSSLMNILKNTSDVEQYCEQHLEGKSYASFTPYMDDLIAQKRFKRQDILARADIPQKYGYKLLTGERHTTDRDKILRICIAMKLSLKETQRALSLYGMQPLYPKNKRDVVFIIALNKGIGSVSSINQRLIELHLPELSTSPY